MLYIAIGDIMDR